jgi:calcium-dependent protein kinase
MEPLYSDEKIEDLYVRNKRLGQGSLGTTYLCTQIANGLQFACKCIPKRTIQSFHDKFSTIAREIEVMYHLKGHPNIATIKTVYEDATKVYIVMELCTGGDLLDRIKQRGFFEESKAKSLMQIITGVVEACHKAGVMHLDLKPENILFQTSDEDAVIKCIDFGASQFFKPGEVFKDLVGTPSYMAPEVWNHCYGQEADIWSSGVILYAMLSGTYPFGGDTNEEIRAELRKGEPPSFEYHPWPIISEDAKDLITKMLSHDPKQRPTASEVLNHRWML